MAEEEPLNLIPNGTLKLDTKSIRTGMLEWKSAWGLVQRSRRSLLRVVCELMMDTVWIQKKIIRLHQTDCRKFRLGLRQHQLIRSEQKQNTHQSSFLFRFTYISVLLDCRRQGTVLLTQVPVSGSTDSTMTKGRSSRVATVRCL